MKYLVSKPRNYLYLFSSLVLVGLATPTPVNAFQLDFTGAVTGDLTNNDPNNTGATLRFSNAAVQNSINLDLLITATDTYTPINSGVNGQAGSLDAGQINIARGTTNSFRFDIVETGTNTLVVADTLDFDIYDIDSNGVSREFITLLTEATYEVSNPDGLDITTTADSVTFSPQTLSAVTNLDDLSNLTSAQEDASVSLQFSNVSSFELVFGDDAPMPFPTAGRNIFFTSDLILNDPTTTTNFQPVPFEFSPTLGLLLSGLGIFGVKRFRKQKMLTQEDLLS